VVGGGCGAPAEGVLGRVEDPIFVSCVGNVADPVEK